MGDEGSNIWIGAAILLMAWVVVIQLMPIFKDQITWVRSPEQLNCSSPSISIGTKGVCIIADASFPYWALMTLGSAFLWAFGRNKNQNANV